MKDSDDHDAIRLDAIVDAIGETRDQCLAHVPIRDTVSLWVIGNGVEYLLHLGHEVASQSWSLAFVPRDRRVELHLRETTEHERQSHCSSRAAAFALTCSQGTTSSGLASSSATRRRNSSRWDSVSKGCAP